MSVPVEKRTSRRAGRLALVVAGGASLAAGATVLSIGPRSFARGVWFAWKVESKRSTELRSDLLALARTRTPWASRILTRHLSHGDEWVRKAALEGLARYFPSSDVARAVAEYESITGNTYFDGWAKQSVPPSYLHEPGALDERIQRWESFVSEREEFPGRDDAGYRLARAYEAAGRPRDAFRTLVAATAWGDRDCDFICRDRITNVLDAQCDLDDARALLEEATPAWRPILEYSVAVKLVQARRFEEGLVALRAFRRDHQGEMFEMLEHAPSYFRWAHEGKKLSKPEAFAADLDAQLAVVSDLARLDAAVRASALPVDRARALIAMGERVVDERHAFQNLVLHDSVRSNNRGGWNHDGPRDERMAAYVVARSHVAQAAHFFESAVLADPTGPEVLRAAAFAAWARLALVETTRREGHELTQAETLPQRRLHAARAVVNALGLASSRSVEAFGVMKNTLACFALVHCEGRRGDAILRALITELDNTTSQPLTEVALGR